MLVHEAFAQWLSVQGCVACPAKLDDRVGALTLGAGGSELTAALIGRVASGNLLAGYVFNRVL
ncbi:MAG: hypothetical protein ACM35F_04565 [Betaproteobacteria bacterium]|jgi:hypothetical protein